MQQRKQIRIPDYDYSQNGYYFVTICTENRERILAEIFPVGADDSVRPYGAFEHKLTPVGKMVEDCVCRISENDPAVSVQKYIVMPNHIHMVIAIDDTAGGQSRPPLPKIVQGFKSVTTRNAWAYGYKHLWQRSFYDHVIRGEAEYLEIWQYIDENPAHWAEDEYYISQ